METEIAEIVGRGFTGVDPAETYKLQRDLRQVFGGLKLDRLNVSADESHVRRVKKQIAMVIVLTNRRVAERLKVPEARFGLLPGTYDVDMESVGPRVRITPAVGNDLPYIEVAGWYLREIASQMVLPDMMNRVCGSLRLGYAVAHELWHRKEMVDYPELVTQRIEMRSKVEREGDRWEGLGYQTDPGELAADKFACSWIKGLVFTDSAAKAAQQRIVKDHEGDIRRREEMAREKVAA